MIVAVLLCISRFLVPERKELRLLPRPMPVADA